MHDGLSDELLQRLGIAFGRVAQEMLTLCNLILTNKKDQAIGVTGIDSGLKEQIKHHLLEYIKAATADAERATEIKETIDGVLNAFCLTATRWNDSDAMKLQSCPR